MVRTVLFTLSVALFVTQQPASAHQVSIRPGERISIRSSATRPDKVEVYYAGTSADTLYAQSPGGRRNFAIPLASITRVEIPRRQSNAVSGAAIGAVIGGTFGILGVAGMSGSFAQPSPGQGIGIIMLCAAIGSIPGAAIGALLPSHQGRWEEVPVDRMRLSLAPHSSGMVTVLSYSF